MTTYASYAHPAGPARWTLGPEVRWAAACAGFTLFDWQNELIDAAMATGGPADDRLTRSQVSLICPRRNGKTQLVMARILAGALAWEEESILYTAHLGDTARHMFTTFLDLLNTSRWLRSQVRRVGYGKGDESVRFTNGSLFSIRARTASGGRGLECSTLILDEALELKDDHMSALTPLLAKANAQGQGQLWVVSSAGHGRSEVLARARDRGRAGADADLCYREWAAPRDADPADPAVWAAANPSLGTPVLSADFLRMQQASLNPEEFGREHLGWWTSEVALPFLPHRAWAANTRTEAPPLPARPRVAWGLELQQFGTRAALVAAVDLGASVWVEVLTRWHDPAGLDPEQLAAEIRATAATAPARPFVIAADEFTCTSILDHLEARRLPVARLNGPQMRAAAQLLHAAVTGTRMPHPPDVQLAAEVGNAGQAPAGDGLIRLSRRTSSGPSTAAFAVAAAAHAVLAPAKPRPAIVVSA